MKVLITGSKGQVGDCLTQQLQDKADILAVDRNELDITDQDAVLNVVNEFKPDYIINAAAHTAVDKAEVEVELSYLINRDGPKYLAQAAQAIGAVMLHISTDYVFDGEGVEPYCEIDGIGPQCVYGKSKLAGEQAVADACEKYLILRTAWVFGEHGHNFVKTMLRLGAERERLGIVADQFGGPTYAGDIASALIKMIMKNESAKPPAWGVYHFSGMPHVSWYDFADAIFDEACSQKLIENKPVLSAISTSDYPTPAKRPANSKLNCNKIQNEFGILPSDWNAALKRIKEYK